MLKCKIESLTEESEEFKMLKTYSDNTKMNKKIKVLECFKIEREGEADKYNPQGLSNKKLLFHGSRFSNFVGILSNGMRIAPPEAPKTGYLFGKGAYFADLSGKSNKYSCPQLSGGTGLFVVCEASLGHPQQFLSPNYDADTLPAGVNSTHALGRYHPDPTGAKTIDNEVEVPMGNAVKFQENGMGANEFIVYNTNQVKMRYIVKWTENE